MTETPEDFPTQGEHLNRLIQLAGTNITQLAKASGVNRETLSRIVNDRDGLGPSVAERIAPVLNVTLETLVLPPEVEVESRRGLERRLRSTEADVLRLRGLLLRVADNAGVELPELQAERRLLQALPTKEP